MTTYSQNGFAYGAISRELGSNIDLPLYQKSCGALVNIIPSPEGDATRRQGFKAIGDQTGTKIKSFSFQLNAQVGYWVVFGVTDISITNITTGAVTTIQNHGYTIDQLEKLQSATFENRMYFVVGTRIPYFLKKEPNADDFSWFAYEPRYGPCLNENRIEVDEKATSSLLITYSGDAAAGTSGKLTMSANYFKAGMEGGVWALFEPSGTLAVHVKWEASTAINSNVFVYFGDNLYKTIDSGNTGVSPPIHVGGNNIVRYNDVRYQYVNSGAAYVRITNVLSATEAECAVQRAIPPALRDGTTGTAFWNEGAWSDYRGWPVSVTFFGERLVFGGKDVKSTDNTEYGEYGRSRTIWATKLQTLDDFDTGARQEIATDSQVLTVSSGGQGGGRIKWLASSTNLLIGTESGIFSVPSIPATESYKNVADFVSYLSPVYLNNDIFYTSTNNRGLIALTYSESSASYESRKVSLRNAPLFKNIKDFVATQNPANTVFCVSEGRLSCYYYDKSWNIEGCYEIKIDNETIVSCSTCLLESGSYLYITTDSGRCGYINLTSNEDPDYTDFGIKESTAYLDILPIGFVQPGLMDGFVKRIATKKVVSVAYTKTQGFYLTTVGRYGQETEQQLETTYNSSMGMSPKIDWKKEFTVNNDSQTIRIKTIEGAALSITGLAVDFTPGD